MKEKTMSAYISVKLTNLPSSAGNLPVNAFEERTLKRDGRKHYLNNLPMLNKSVRKKKKKRYYSFSKLIIFPISGGMGPEKWFPSMLLQQECVNIAWYRKIWIISQTTIKAIIAWTREVKLPTCLNGTVYTDHFAGAKSHILSKQRMNELLLTLDLIILIKLLWNVSNFVLIWLSW